MAQGTWVLEKCAGGRFPYRLPILREDKLWIVLRTQDRWSAAGRHIFCLREDEPPSPDEVLEEPERGDIIVFHERGRRVSVVLDRKRYKRCDFLFLTKSYFDIVRLGGNRGISFCHCERSEAIPSLEIASSLALLAMTW